jgi:hypothetical protein
MGKISRDAFRGEEIILKRLVNIPKIVKKGTLERHSVGDIEGKEVLAMNYNSDHTRGGKSSADRYSVW